MRLNIKRKIALCMVFVILLALLAGCHEDIETASRGTISDFESQAHIQVSTPEDESTPEEVSQAPLTGEFVVSEKKYDYKDDNLMLLYVENQTNRHFNVTIKGKYLDENGKVIKEESQTYKAFPAGWSNHFIFYPKFAFDSFTYELETEEYTNEPIRSDESGLPYASYIELSYEKKLIWQRGSFDWEVGGAAIEGRELLFYAIMENHHPSVTIAAEFHVILLDDQGEIYLTDYDYIAGGISGTATGPIGSEDNGKSRTPIPLVVLEVGADETIPDNVQGVFTAIFALTNVIDIDRFMEQIN